MADKSKVFWVVGVIIVIALMAGQEKKEGLMEDIGNVILVGNQIQSPLKQGFDLASNLDSCRVFRDATSSEGKACVGSCVQITSKMLNCPTFGDRIDSGDVGKYGYFYDNDDSCSENANGDGGSNAEDIWDCMYGQSCTDECSLNTKLCISDTNYWQCGQYDSDTCLEWGDRKNCASGLSCSDDACKASQTPPPTADVWCVLKDCSNCILSETTTCPTNSLSTGYPTLPLCTSARQTKCEGTWSPAVSTKECGEAFNQVNSATSATKSAVGTSCKSGTCNLETGKCEKEVNLSNWIWYLVLGFVVIIGVKLMGKAK